ncbi:hypothetical protein AWM70_20245 [Paenibacillus yonginensis]|uniref:VOC domain-containing protein n=1 Tax=Paenibacillus yonginensis TaxID=1462996 RepID=A0A1B1N5A4_9BACL|nr:glyoxalase/bleomycin resistance/dioxygenase family protein [Paenibacillus yonginensis]ANS76620.1 hypothetical protein AWM70_20245 [Paenibacillus yonginensis]
MAYGLQIEQLYSPCEQQNLSLARRRRDFAPPGSVLYFGVEHIQEAYQELLGKGVEFRDKPHVIAEMHGIQTWMVFFYDPDLNLHALISEESTVSRKQ